MRNYEHPDWVRLGRAVYAARNRAGYSDMVVWADKVGRSTRMLLGLERGERVGRGTLDAIETVLKWPTGHSHALLSGADDNAFPVTPMEPSTELSEIPDDQLIAELAARLTRSGRRTSDVGSPITTVGAEADSNQDAASVTAIDSGRHDGTRTDWDIPAGKRVASTRRRPKREMVGDPDIEAP